MLSSSATDVGGASVGLLGEVSQDQALACLLSCPLLEDMEQWSQWEVVFRPVHGPLKDFIERNAGTPFRSVCVCVCVCACACVCVSVSWT
jgi:cell division inhibitor SulA